MLCAGGPGNLSSSDLSLKDMSRLLHWRGLVWGPLGQLVDVSLSLMSLPSRSQTAATAPGITLPYIPTQDRKRDKMTFVLTRCLFGFF